MANKIGKFSWVLMIVLVLSCQKQERPAGIMSQEEFSRYLVDIYLAEARLTLVGMPKDSALKLFRPHEEKLLRDRAMADSTLKKTYQYYFDHPKEMEAVYDAVIDTLSLREQRGLKKPEAQ